MKKTFKTITISVLTILAFTINTNAQRRTNKVVKTKVTTTKSNKNKLRTVSRTDVKYKNSKKKVTTYRKIPTKTVVIKNNNNTYHYDNNKFYRNYNGRYIAVVPNPGIRISKLPIGYKTIRHGKRNYFNYGGVFYINANNQYEVVHPEIGTIVYELPRDSEKVIIRNEVLYEFSNILYEKIQYNGTRAYEVVGIIE